MNFIVELIKIIIRTIIYYSLAVGLYELFNKVKILKLKKLAIFSILLISSIIFGLFFNVLCQYIYFLYIIPLIVIYKGVLKESGINTYLSIIISHLTMSSCEGIAYLITKSYTYLPISKITTSTNHFFEYAILMTLSSAIIINLLFKYVDKNKEKIKIVSKNLKNKDIILIFCIVASILIPVIFHFKLNSFKLEIYMFMLLATLIFMLAIYSKHYIQTQSNIIETEIYIKSLLNIIDNLRIIKHDYNNILQSINGYLLTKQYDELEKHILKLTNESKKMALVEKVNPNVINQPAVYGVIGSKFFVASDKNIKFNIDVSTNIQEINFDFTQLSRVLGILLDNAIEASEQAESKEMSITFSYNKRKQADMIEIRNTIKPNVKIDVDKIFNKGESSKKVKSGLGLWEVKKIISSKENSQIYTDINKNTFSQIIIIEKT
jgi:two-component system sensor histidine kinase AgrC